MFSRKERHFLDICASTSCNGGDLQRALVEAFPNPTYRRKLLWGIRRKAESALADWELYASAARIDSRVLPGQGAKPSENPPVIDDPLVKLLRSVQALLKHPGAASQSRSKRSSSTSNREGRK
jgi:hypothetical protein